MKNSPSCAYVLQKTLNLVIIPVVVLLVTAKKCAKTLLFCWVLVTVIVAKATY